MLKLRLMLSLSIGLLITVSLWESCARLRHGETLKFSESDHFYRFKAYYDPDQTQEVENYINKCTSPNRLFRSGQDQIDAMTILDDHTKFNIRSCPGELEIELDKGVNTRSSYSRIKEMCEGIKRELLQH